jgi:predicted HAD superfamily hydrolase
MVGIPESLLAGRDTSAPPWERIGLSVAGPLYLGFTQWLIKKLAEFDPQRIYFFSRDGQIVHRFYAILRNFYPGVPVPTYLMVSRRALAVPTLERIDAPALNMLCGADNQLAMPVETYLTRIGLDPGKCQTAMFEHGLSSESLIDGSEMRGRLYRLFQSLEAEILSVARRERVPLVRYLQQEGCFESDRLALCDIGWKGTMQMALASVLKSELPAAQLSGYYLGTEDCIQRLVDSGGIAAGWLVDGSRPEKRRRILQSGLALVELLFTANHGSVRGYRDEEGKVTPTLERLGIESDYVRAAEAIQSAALQFANRYVKAFGGLCPIDLTRSDIFPALARLIDRPTLLEAEALGNLIHVNGLGNAELGQPIARPPSFWQSMVRPSAAIAKFRQAPWRLGFLVRFTRIPHLAFVAMMLRRSLEPRSRLA